MKQNLFKFILVLIGGFAPSSLVWGIAEDSSSWTNLLSCQISPELAPELTEHFQEPQYFKFELEQRDPQGRPAVEPERRLLVKVGLHHREFSFMVIEKFLIQESDLFTVLTYQPSSLRSMLRGFLLVAHNGMSTMTWANEGDEGVSENFTVPCTRRPKSFRPVPLPVESIETEDHLMALENYSVSGNFRVMQDEEIEALRKEQKDVAEQPVLAVLRRWDPACGAVGWSSAEAIYDHTGQTVGYRVNFYCADSVLKNLNIKNYSFQSIRAAINGAYLSLANEEVLELSLHNAQPIPLPFEDN